MTCTSMASAEYQAAVSPSDTRDSSRYCILVPAVEKPRCFLPGIGAGSKKT